MKRFNRIFASVIVILVLILIGVNFFLSYFKENTDGRPYRVEAGRIAKKIEQDGYRNLDLSEYVYITNIERYDGKGKDFFQDIDSDYLIRQIDGEVYRFDYVYQSVSEHKQIAIVLNVALGILSLLIIVVLIFIRLRILKPFLVLRDVPYELSKGNLTVPIKESKSHFFGKFVWGVDMLREHMEYQKQRELELQRDKKTLVLSISHDIKTPLSAIKLYSKVLSKGLYKDTEMLNEVAENINAKANEIEEFVSQIIKTQNEDFLNLEVSNGEFYFSELINKISKYYSEKLELIQTAFSVGAYSDCILKGDLDRSVEVLQNIIENAIKYGDGHRIEILFSEEEKCRLMTVKNSGCTLPETELPHIFDSFWRGSNTGSNTGSGLGLYICRQLMYKMDGDIFANIDGDTMCITTVFRETA